MLSRVSKRFLLPALILAIGTGETSAETQVVDLLQVQPVSAWTITNPHAPGNGTPNPQIQSVSDTGTSAGPGVRSDAVGLTNKNVDIATVDRTFTLPAIRATAGGTLSLYFDTGLSGQFTATSFTVALILNGKEVGRRSYGVRATHQGTALDQEIPAGQVSGLDLGAVNGVSLFDQVRIILNHYVGIGSNFNEISDLTLTTNPEAAQTPSQRFLGLINLVSTIPASVGQMNAAAAFLQEARQSVLGGEAAFDAGDFDGAIQAYDAALTPFTNYTSIVEVQKRQKIIDAMGQAWFDSLVAADDATAAALALARLRAVQQKTILAMRDDLAQALLLLQQAFPDGPDEVAWRQATMEATEARAESYLIALGTDDIRMGLIRKGNQTQLDFYITTWLQQFQFAFHSEEDFLNDPGTLGGSLLFEAPFYITWPDPPLPALDIVCEGTFTPNSVTIGGNLEIAFDSLEGSVFVDALNGGPDDLLLLSLTLTAPDGRTCTRALLVHLANP